MRRRRWSAAGALRPRVEFGTPMKISATNVLHATLQALGCAASLLLATACGEPHSASRAAVRPDPVTLTIAAASSLKELVETTAPTFEAAHPGAQLLFSLDASSTLARQIESGAAFDAFLSADAATLDRLGERIAAGTRREFLSNRLAVVVRAGIEPLPADGAALVALPGKLALAGEAVPAGKYARAWLTSRGLLDQLATCIVNGDNVRATLALVESGAADAAVVYATDARVATRARLAFVVPEDEAPGIVYVAGAIAVKSPGPQSALAGEYVTWLASAELQATALQLGFVAPRSAP